MAVRFTPGGVLGIPLADGRLAYALMLSTYPYVAFYRADPDQDAEEALRQKPAFILGVSRSAYSDGRWGDVLLRVQADVLPEIPLFFRQSRINPEECFLVDASENTTKVSPADCVGYERESAWAAQHVESRLSDMYAGRPSAVVEASRPVISRMR